MDNCGKENESIPWYFLHSFCTFWHNVKALTQRARKTALARVMKHHCDVSQVKVVSLNPIFLFSTWLTDLPFFFFFSHFVTASLTLALVEVSRYINN